MGTKSWPPEDEQIVRDCWGKHSGRTIAKNFLQNRYSRNAVLGKAFRMGLENPLKTPDPNEPKPVRVRRPKPVVVGVPLPDPQPIGPINDFSGCKWISGDPKPEFQTCGHPLKAGTSWCEFHAARATIPQTGRSKVDPDVRRRSGIDRAFG